MKTDLPDINRFERKIFKKLNALIPLLAFSQKLMESRQVGLLYGTDNTNVQYLPPDQWDRGVMHKFNGSGFRGLMLKWFGPWLIKARGLSPVMLYKEDQYGDRQDNEGIIAYVLRKHSDFYRKGIKILIIDIEKDVNANTIGIYSDVSVLSYNGSIFQPIDNLKVNTEIIQQFNARNFISAYVPDYGAIVFNTINHNFLERKNDHFINEKDLKDRLDTLISAIEMASLAHIGRAKGRQAAQIIWHKEKNLRKTALKLQQKEIELEAQRKYLRAVGAVSAKQLNMAAVTVPEGVYSFMDMVGSAAIYKKFIPQDFFFILNLCHQIAADNAAFFSCRVDNFIGDCVFIENASPFDANDNNMSPPLNERIMVMIFTLASTITQIDQLKKGTHPHDTQGLVKKLIDQTGADVAFRAGIEFGSAMIGPLGSDRRKVVTAIGKRSQIH